MIEAATAAQSLRVDEQGRVVIPAQMGEALGLRPGDALVARVQDGRIVIRTRQSLAEELRGLLSHIEGSLADELIEERRAEAQRELDDFNGRP